MKGRNDICIVTQHQATTDRLYVSKKSSALSDPGSSSHDNEDGWMSGEADVDGWGAGWHEILSHYLERHAV